MMLAFLLATLFTYIVDHATNAQTTLIRGTAVFCAQLLAFGIVWVGRYIVFDRWLFKPRLDAADAITATKAQGRHRLWWLNRPAAAPSVPSQEAPHPATP